MAEAPGKSTSSQASGQADSEWLVGTNAVNTVAEAKKWKTKKKRKKKGKDTRATANNEEDNSQTSTRESHMTDKASKSTSNDTKSELEEVVEVVSSNVTSSINHKAVAACLDVEHDIQQQKRERINDTKRELEEVVEVASSNFTSNINQKAVTACLDVGQEIQQQRNEAINDTKRELEEVVEVVSSKFTRNIDQKTVEACLDVEQEIQQQRNETINELNKTESEAIQRIKEEGKLVVEDKKPDVCTFIAEQVRCFEDSVQKFLVGHYVLVVDKLTNENNVQSLALVPWLAVFDLDVDSWKTGLLSCIQDHLAKSRSVHRKTWQDKSIVTSENATNWVSMIGSSDLKESLVDNMPHGPWRRKIQDSFHQQLDHIKKFADNYTILSVVALWTADQEKAKMMKHIVETIIDTQSPKVTMVVNERSKGCVEANALHSDEPSTVTKVQIEFSDLANILESNASVSYNSNTKYQIPSKISGTKVSLTNSQAQLVKEDLDVLYLDNTTGVSFEDESCRTKHADEFYKGGTLSWSWWYQFGSNAASVERDIQVSIVEHIQSQFIATYKQGYITILHNPGSGGTTLAQGVMWALRTKVPCVQVKQRPGVTAPSVVDKIKLIYRLAQCPVVVLFDGEERTTVSRIYSSLQQEHVAIIILYVRRFWATIGKPPKDCFWLQNSLTIAETRRLEFHLESKRISDIALKNIGKLAKDVYNNESQHSLLDFGLAMYGTEYKGVIKYVSGYLKLEGIETIRSSRREFEPWQKALAFLSLISFYGQASLPCHFFTAMLESENAILSIDDLPNQMRGLVVQDKTHERPNVVRICHFLVAKEILDQILSFPNIPGCRETRYLTSDAKRNLGKFAVEFIIVAGQCNSGKLTEISKVMTKTFINRNNQVVGETETQAQEKKRPVAPILDQVSRNPPFTERFDILTQLTVSFPEEPQFIAHLGRLYSICRPEEEDLAEKCFEHALSMSEHDVKRFISSNMPIDMKIDLMYIYHMYGNFLLTKVGKFTGKWWDSEPSRRFDEDNFIKGAKALLDDAKKACQYFTECRKISPPGFKGSFGYIGEMQLRLMICKFVSEKSNCRSVLTYQDHPERIEALADFVHCSCTIIDDLFTECVSAVEPEKFDKTLFKCRQWQLLLFDSDFRAEAKDINSRRIRIFLMKKKSSQANKDRNALIEDVQKADELESIVKLYEENFEEYFSESYSDVSSRMLDIDFKEWLTAIRLPRMVKLEKRRIEDILKLVSKWYDMYQSQDAKFYYFVLTSLLGFGKAENRGNEALLKKALTLKDEIYAISKYVPKPRYPREWLGLPTEYIHRLKRGNRFFSNVDAVRVVTDDTTHMEVRKGTIRPNSKENQGYIELDLGSEIRTAVKVFFVPARADDDLKGNMTGARVEFVMAFSMFHGYDAYNVKRLGRVDCTTCRLKVEYRSVDRTVECPKCEGRIRVN